MGDKMARLSVQWREQQAEARRLDAEIGEPGAAWVWRGRPLE